MEARAGELRGYDRVNLSDPEDFAEEHGETSFYVVTFGPDDPVIELTPTDKRNEAVLFAYSSVPNLVTSCGGGQPYERFTASQIQASSEMGDAADLAVLVALDVFHPLGARYMEPDYLDFEPLEEMSTEDVPEEPLLWVPSRPIRRGDRVVTVEMHSTRAGEALLLAFDTPELAWAACGPWQPLAGIHVDRILHAADQCGATEVIVNDGFLVEEARHQGPVKDWTREIREEYLT